MVKDLVKIVKDKGIKYFLVSWVEIFDLRWAVKQITSAESDGLIL